MTINSSPIAAKPRSLVVNSLVSDYLRFTFHEASGANVAYTGILSSAAVSGNVALNGTVTNIWDSRGHIKPEAGVGNANIQAAGVNTPWEDHFRTDTAGTKGMLITFSFFWDGTPGTGNRILAYGVLGTRGGWHITTSVGVAVNIQFEEHEVGATATVQTKKSYGAPDGTGRAAQHTCVIYTDGTTSYMGIDGDWASADSDDVSGLTHIGRLTNDGIGFLAQTDFSGTAFNTELNHDITAGNETKINNLFIMRANFTQTELATLCAELQAQPRELPWTLLDK